MALDNTALEALAHRFADELIWFDRTGETRDADIMDRIERLVDGKLEKVTEILMREGFDPRNPGTWKKWDNDWVIQCKKAREAAARPKIWGPELE